MELPRRAHDDRLLRPGELTDIRRRLRAVADAHDLASVVVCAFDRRTRMLPFIYADVRMAPAGPRAIASALADAGFAKTRLLLQQWNPRARPSAMRLDGRVPDLLLISSMSLHTAACRALLRDARRMPPDRRPLVVVGGSVCVYEPWNVFSDDPDRPFSPDVAVTGEEYVLLHLLEVVLSARRAGAEGRGEPLRRAFARARDAGMLDDVPGLVYGLGARDGVAEVLVDTGIQRLAGDLDELPHPAGGFALLERPGKSAELAPRPLPPGQVRRHSRIASLVMTFGCKFSCPYCSIGAYNQGHYRTKSGERIADEMHRLWREYGIRYFFGTDDNFFNDHRRTLEVAETLARTEVDGYKLRRKARWGTEVTVHDTLRLREHLPLIRTAGARALWLGVEDMTGSLVKKGQTVDTTREAFGLLRKHGISATAMMMHHDSQPLYTRTSDYGLLNQIRLLRKAGATDMQALMISPAPGSRLYDQTYESGMVFASAAGKQVELHMIDGNYVIASDHPKPWRKQLNIIAAYMYFYNPVRFLSALIRPKSGLYLIDAAVQAAGMAGLCKTVPRTLMWALRLRFGKIKRHVAAPASPIPMCSVDGGPAAHALPSMSAPQSEWIPAAIAAPSPAPGG